MSEFSPRLYEMASYKNLQHFRNSRSIYNDSKIIPETKETKHNESSISNTPFPKALEALLDSNPDSFNNTQLNQNFTQTQDSNNKPLKKKKSLKVDFHKARKVNKGNDPIDIIDSDTHHNVESKKNIFTTTMHEELTHYSGMKKMMEKEQKELHQRRQMRLINDAINKSQLLRQRFTVQKNLRLNQDMLMRKKGLATSVFTKNNQVHIIQTQRPGTAAVNRQKY